MLSNAYISKYYHSTDVKGDQALCLSMVISHNSFVYAISVNNFKSVVEICHVQFTEAQHVMGFKERISFLIQNYFLDRKKFEKINIAILNTDFAMIPEGYADQESLKPLLKFTIGGEQVKNVLQHTVNGIKFCYSPDTELDMYLEKTFPNASVKHAGAVGIHLLFGQQSLKNCDLFLNIYDEFIELAAKNKNDLLFYNIFNYDTNEDILYYLLFMMEQFGLDPLTMRLGIAAQRPVDDDIFKSIKKYIKQVDFCSPDPSVILNGDLSKLPGHYYFTLLNQHLCEL